MVSAGDEQMLRDLEQLPARRQPEASHKRKKAAVDHRLHSALAAWPEKNSVPAETRNRTISPASP
ncbi:hypothetical protein [Melghirimyces profundicolus]|uniref:hypothetical protein n=1 Tax=Melghirimyces profundicolus TaxID=1242148 RepID=UPI0011B27C4F|nr:hypothetical protein [Melghirimyces profundicolus]